MPELVRRPGRGARLARLWQFAIVMALALAFALPAVNTDSERVSFAQEAPSTDEGPRWNADAADYDPTTTPSNLDELKELEQIVVDTVAAVRPAVVGLLIEGQAGGSGAFVSPDGWIAGCCHVNGQPNRRCKVFLADGTTVDGMTMGQNAELDLALVKADLGDRTVPYVSFGDAAEVEVGEWLLSMGHPMGREAGRGPVVRLGRVFNAGSLIRLDAPLISGDSGGPTFTLTGKIVGINNSIMPNDHRQNNLARSDFMRDHYEAMKDPDFSPTGGNSDTIPLGQYERLLTDAAVLLDAGQWHDADDKLMQAITLNPDDHAGFYMHARLHGLRSASDEAEDDDIALVYDQLGKAVDRGFGNIGQLERDRAFTHLHDTDAWADLIAKIEASGNAPPRERAFLGVNIQEQMGEVVITAITPGCAAENAGLLPGDVFVKFAGQSIASTADLRDAVLSLTPGEEAIVVVRRNDEEMKFIVLLGARADDPTVPNNPGSNGEMLEGKLWKDGDTMRELVRAISEPLSQAVVRVRVGNRAVALGTVVRSDGYILTKLSEVSGSDNVRVQLPNGRLVTAQIVNEDETLDLALLKVAARRLDTVTFTKTDEEHTIGEFVLSVGHRERAMSVGVVSLEGYVTRSQADRPFLGVGVGDPVTPEDLEGTGHEAGCRFGEITPGSGADAAGLQAGDICVAIDGQPTPEFQVLAEIIGTKEPGDKITMTIVRAGEVMELEATLGRRGQPEQPAQPNNPFPFPLPGVGGVEGPVSTVRSGFGNVIQHDGNVQPAQVGSPLVNLDGEVIGLNIARGDRTKTYAIPGAALVEVVPNLIKTARKVTGPDEDDEEEDF